jgi:hypothetical protein
MKRLLALAVIAAAASFGTSAQATGVPSPSGQCDRGNVDVVCRTDTCNPDYPCTPQICVVWGGYGCKA